MRNLYVRINDETHNKLKVEAIKRNMTFSKYISEILDKAAQEI
jgi:predicted HicB family RNase H-like nuclease